MIIREAACKGGLLVYISRLLLNHLDNARYIDYGVA